MFCKSQVQVLLVNNWNLLKIQARSDFRLGVYGVAVMPFRLSLKGRAVAALKSKKEKVRDIPHLG